MSAASPHRPPDPGIPWLAEVEWRHHARRGRFCAVAHGSGRSPAVVGESPWLDWPPTGETAVEAMAEAVRDLERRLLAAGWRPVEQGEGWYAKRFAWAGAPQPAPQRPPDPRRRPAEHVNGTGPTSPAAPAPPAAANDALWRCEIGWDTGYVTSRFVALGFPPGRERPRPLGASARLKSLLRGEPDAGSAEHDRAVRALEAALLEAGWERAGRGARWYAQRFVWRRPGAPPPHVEPSEPPPDEAAQVWRCEIAWQAGYVNSRFVALAYGPGDRRGRQLGASPPLRWLFRDDPDPRVAQHPEAVRALEAALLAAGWERAGHGRDWYAQRFVWQRDGPPPDRVDPEVAEAERPA